MCQHGEVYGIRTTRPLGIGMSELIRVRNVRQSCDRKVAVLLTRVGEALSIAEAPRDVARVPRV